MILYDAIWNEEYYTLHADTIQEARQSMDVFFAESFEDERLENGVEYSDECIIVGADDEGEIVEKHNHVMSFEYYHGDYEEHNTYYRGGAI